MRTNNRFLFWQPKTDYLKSLAKSKFKLSLLVVLNYLIWIFLFYISYLLARHSTLIIGKIFIITLLSEVIEKILKKRIYWRRPLFVRHDKTPPGLIDSWYKTGSFPSGHTIKATYFLMLILQYQVFNPFIYLLIVLPLLTFRVIVGFHYPVDMLGGGIIGVVLYLLATPLSLPTFVNSIVDKLFKIIFYVR